MTSFNHVYYAFSPAMADLERKDPMVRDTVRAVITPMIASLTIFENIEINSEVDVITYGVLVIWLTSSCMWELPLYILKQYLPRMSKNKKYILLNNNLIKFIQFPIVKHHTLLMHLHD